MNNMPKNTIPTAEMFLQLIADGDTRIATWPHLAAELKRLADLIGAHDLKLVQRLRDAAQTV